MTHQIDTKELLELSMKKKISHYEKINKSLKEHVSMLIDDRKEDKSLESADEKKDELMDKY